MAMKSVHIISSMPNIRLHQNDDGSKFSIRQRGLSMSLIKKLKICHNKNAQTRMDRKVKLKNTPDEAKTEKH